MGALFAGSRLCRFGSDEAVKHLDFLFIMSLATLGQSTAALNQQLLSENSETLARDARRLGDARRGALVFHQPSLTCTKCHVSETGTPALGPDLAAIGKDVQGAYLVESILDPSKAIKKGYETITISTADGRTLTGLLAERRPDAIVLRDPGQDGKPVTIPKSDIEERRDGGISIMPAGLASNLNDRQQFLDLVRYLMEIAEKGPQRARELKPDPALLQAAPLPRTDSDIDHAGLISDLNQASYKRGEAIYNRVCANCHGTKDRPGSLPTSLRFASGTFKNGADPFGMYRTLTLGFGQMTPQTWMVPRQRYDVIHYIREAFVKPHNAGQYTRVGRDYLARLPPGKSRGREPVEIQPWATMDYGPSLMATYEVSPGDRSNIAYKGIAIRLDPGPGGVSLGGAWALYDQDTMRLAAFWTGQGFIDWNGINFNGVHQVHPRLAGTVELANPNEPAWANPRDGRFDDLRLRGRDGRPYGPLPRDWLHYRGLYAHGDRTILAYSIGQVQILEAPGVDWDRTRNDAPVFTRTLNIGRSSHDLVLRVAPTGTPVALAGAGNRGVELKSGGGATILHISASSTPINLKLVLPPGEPKEQEGSASTHARGISSAALHELALRSPPAEALDPLTRGGPMRWPERLTTRAAIGLDSGPFAVDILNVPSSNPWLCQLRLSGFDFLPDGRRAAVCTWDGDVWLVDGVDRPQKGLTWRRIASGLFQPLGLKVVAGTIYVCCRDEIVRLHDMNADGETDFYENFNNDHQVTEHFHEFAMDLQTDADGNFYYAKAACHGLPAIVPHHGTLLKVSKDGSRTDILATGFRAPNGVCVNPDGTFFLTDQEGFWTPKNRVNWVKPGGFYGNLWGFTDVTDPSDSAMQQPICWLTNAFDRSPAQVLRVETANPGWKSLAGTLLCLSYGYGKIFVVPHEIVSGQMQGGECALPIPRLPTGIMRGRFHPGNGQLYTCGLFGWAGDQTEPGGFFRIRATGKPMYLPTGLNARRDGITVHFSDPLDAASVADLSQFSVKIWSIKRTVNYGSEHHNQRTLKVVSAELSSDRCSLFLEIPEIRPTWCMEIGYRITSSNGKKIDGMIHNTIHKLP
jgi:putative heme-binding domain-containing protein